jgi:hypothetical protein
LLALLGGATIVVVNRLRVKSAELKNLAVCFSYNEPSSGQKQIEVLVHSMIVHFMGLNIELNVPGIRSVFDLMMARS